jgi:parallel beta-helix repeat protein
MSVDYLDLETGNEIFNNFSIEHIENLQVWKRAFILGKVNLPTIENIDSIFRLSGAELEHLSNLEIIHANDGDFFSLKNKLFDFSNMATSSEDKKYTLKFVECQNLVLKNIIIKYSDFSGVLIHNCSNILIENCIFEHLDSFAIVVAGNTKNVTIKNCHISHSRAGVIIGECSSYIKIDSCIIKNGTGKSNWSAGIVLTDRSQINLKHDPDSIFGFDKYWAIEERIFDRISFPHNCLFVNNTIKNNLSSGIYFDGGLDCVVFENVIDANSKEGICLDYGATRNTLFCNKITRNGNRWGKTDFDLEKDFVLHHGRMDDGTPAAKVPGISIDNAILNIIQHNHIYGNFGSGIKLVRSSGFNYIGYNAISENNRGVNRVNHFFGIEIGSASADGSPDLNIPQELDFSPGYSNLVFRNIISGDHYAGIFLDYGCENNHIFDNSIYGCTNWSIEAVDKNNHNQSFNNLSFIHSRNIYLGKTSITINNLGDNLIDG